MTGPQRAPDRLTSSSSLHPVVRFFFDWMISLAIYSLLMGLAVFFSTLVAAAVGYLPYGERPVPG
jgi:hypothetical protein